MGSPAKGSPVTADVFATLACDPPNGGSCRRAIAAKGRTRPFPLMCTGDPTGHRRRHSVPRGVFSLPLDILNVCRAGESAYTAHTPRRQCWPPGVDVISLPHAGEVRSYSAFADIRPSAIITMAPRRRRKMRCSQSSVGLPAKAGNDWTSACDLPNGRSCRCAVAEEGRI